MRQNLKSFVVDFIVVGFQSTVFHPFQMRRSARVVKRKKYVDDLDLNLSEDESNDAEKTSELAADDCDGLPSTFSQKELFEVTNLCLSSFQLTVSSDNLNETSKPSKIIFS